MSFMVGIQRQSATLLSSRLSFISDPLLESCMSGSLPAPSRQSDVSALLEFATSLFRRSIATTLPLAMAGVLASEGASFYWLSRGNKLDKLPADTTYWALFAVGTAVSLWFVAAIFLRQRALLRNTLGPMRNDLVAAWQRWPVLVLATLIGIVLVAAGTLALFIPGIFLAVCIAPLTAVVMFESLTPLESVKRCISLVRPMWLKAFAALLIAALIVVVVIVTLVLVVSMIATLLAGTGKAGTAVTTTLMLAAMAAAQVFFCALCYTIYSAANSSA
jgi:hypothetical protein